MTTCDECLSEFYINISLLYSICNKRMYTQATDLYLVLNYVYMFTEPYCIIMY